MQEIIPEVHEVELARQAAKDEDWSKYERFVVGKERPKRTAHLKKRKARNKIARASRRKNR